MGGMSGAFLYVYVLFSLLIQRISDTLQKSSMWRAHSFVCPLRSVPSYGRQSWRNGTSSCMHVFSWQPSSSTSRISTAWIHQAPASPRWLSSCTIMLVSGHLTTPGHQNMGTQVEEAMGWQAALASWGCTEEKFTYQYQVPPSKCLFLSRKNLRYEWSCLLYQLRSILDKCPPAGTGLTQCTKIARRQSLVSFHRRLGYRKWVPQLESDLPVVIAEKIVVC